MGKIMRDIFFDNLSLRSQGFAVSSFPVYRTAEPELEFVGMPGHDGDDVVSNVRYKNVEETIEINSIPHGVFLKRNETEIAMALKDWLVHSDGQYREYRDSLFPGYFSKAVCTSVGDIQTSGFNKLVETTLTFNRVPWWYSDLGNQQYTISELNKQTIINNPEKYTALPTIVFEGAGVVNLMINGNRFTIKDLSKHNNYLLIDGETGNCTGADGESLDSRVEFNYPPILLSGTNTIEIVYGGSSTVQFKRMLIIPHWRRL